MSWRIVYIEESEKLLLYLDNIKIIKGVHETIVPLADINTIMLDNMRTVISARLISKCADYNIMLYVCDVTHTPHAVVVPLSGSYQATRVLRMQLAWSDDVQATVWQHIIRLKITQQAHVAALCSASEDVVQRLGQFAQDVSPYDALNCEGLAAKMYFRTIFGADFLRADETVINAALNYGYSVVRSQVARAIVAHGLNAHIGIFHRGPGNAFNLADDLIEPLRPIIDYWVVKNINPHSMFVREHRLALIALMTKKVRYREKKVTLIFAINDIVERFMSVMEGGELDAFVYPEIKIYDL